MPLYSLKVQTLATRWEHFHSSSSAIFVDDAVPQWVLYCVCGHKKNDGAGKFLSTRPTARIWHLRTCISSPTWKKHLRAKRFKSHGDVKLEVQTWLRGQYPTFYRQGFEKWISHLDKCLNREGDYVEKEVKCNKWMKRHLTMWSYLVAI